MGEGKKGEGKGEEIKKRREEKEGGRKKKRKKGRKEEMKRKYCGPCWMFLAWRRQILSLFFSSSMSSL